MFGIEMKNQMVIHITPTLSHRRRGGIKEIFDVLNLGNTAVFRQTFSRSKTFRRSAKNVFLPPELKRTALQKYNFCTPGNVLKPVCGKLFDLLTFSECLHADEI